VADSNLVGFDIVHVHLARELVVLSVVVAARRRRFHYVVQTHGQVVPSRNPLAPPLDAVWTRKVLRDAGAVFYLNAQERGQLVPSLARAFRWSHWATVCRTTTRPRRLPDHRRFCSPPGCIRGSVLSRSWRWRGNCSTPVSTRDSRW
jgi:hypothetical protein